MNPDGGHPPDQAPRAIRVFVSSTFRDMHAEREELVKRAFPQLRELCESRGVSWSEVDLRWGITEDQQARGEVLSICLEEIEECRPYFLGLLGERYGSIPSRLDPVLVAQEPWLQQYENRSITELEIVHGVLRDPSMAGRAFFYFRDPAYARSHPGNEEAPSAREIEELGPVGAEQLSQQRREKLVALKNHVRASGLPVRENYRNPVELGALVLDDITKVIDELFPAGSEPSPTEREHELHEEFARARAAVYIARASDLEQLERHVASTDPPLVVVGESGVGKSALLANWARRSRARQQRAQPHPAALVMHFIAASPASRDWIGMLQRLIGELNAHFGLDLQIPDEREELRAAFATALSEAADRGTVVMVLDALDQLEDRDGAPDLLWLPDPLPRNIRVVLSTLPGRPLAAARRRRLKTFEVKALGRDEREQLIVRYLAQYAKTLPAEMVHQIASARASRNPLFLRTLLEELRIYGDHQTLARRVGELLAAGGRRGRAAEAIPSLYELVLARWEDDYERDRQGLVDDAMSLIWCARRGLAERELLELLGGPQGPMPHAFWSPLRIAAKQALAEHAGLLTFAHAYVRQAIAQRYVGPGEERRVVHAQLAEYFRTRPRTATRTLDELPWQLREAGDWEGLYEVLADPEFRDALGEVRDYELTGYWLDLERNARALSASGQAPGRGILDASRPVLQAPDAQPVPVLERVAKLLADTDHGDEALRLYEHLAERFSAAGDQTGLQSVLRSRAEIMRSRGELDQALELYREQERLSRQLGDDDGVQAAIGGHAKVDLARRDLDGATALLEERERICRQTSNRDGLAEALGDQAIVLRMRGRLGPALARHEQQEQVARQAANQRLVGGALSGEAAILVAQGRLRRADPLLAAWRDTWWEFANDEERRRWRLGLNLTDANRRIIFYLKLIVISIAGLAPIADATIQIGTQSEAVSNQTLIKALAWLFFLAALAIIGSVSAIAVLQVRLRRARKHYRATEIASEVGQRTAPDPRQIWPPPPPGVTQAMFIAATEPALLRDRGERATLLRRVENRLHNSFTRETELGLAIAALLVGTLMAATAIHHLLGTTLPCFHMASDVAPCSGGFGWYFAVVIVGMCLVVLSALVLNGEVLFPAYLGVIGVAALIAGLGSPVVGITKGFPIGFGAFTILAGLALGAAFWITARR